MAQSLALAATSLCCLQQRSGVRAWGGRAGRLLDAALVAHARALHPHHLCTLVQELGRAQVRAAAAVCRWARACVCVWTRAHL